MNQIIKESKTVRTFKYKKGEVELNFSLRIDTKKEVKDFLECVKAAVVELEEELIKK